MPYHYNISTGINYLFLFSQLRISDNIKLENIPKISVETNVVLSFFFIK